MPTLNIQHLLTKWQKRLRLQDFNISVEWADSDQLPTQVGRTHVSWPLSHARVYLLHPKYNGDKAEQFRDVELTLVHELLHIVLWPVLSREPTQLESCLQEQVIEKLARSLCDRF